MVQPTGKGSPARADLTQAEETEHGQHDHDGTDDPYDVVHSETPVVDADQTLKDRPFMAKSIPVA